MYFLGVLAIFQMLFFPGLIFHSFYKPKGGFFFQLSVIVILSMLANFLVFYPLIYIHLYTRPVVLVIIGLEVAALLWLYRGIFRTRLDDLGQSIHRWSAEVVQSVSALFKNEKYSAAVNLLRNILILTFLGLAISLLFWFLRRMMNNFGTVFVNWDAIVSWNAWAQIWAQGRVPAIHLTYPQLLPINLSLTYLLTGNYEVSLFAKAVMPIFALLTVLTIFELAIEKKQYGYLIAVVLVYLLYKKFLGDLIVDGYADVPVAFMAWIALIPYLRSDDLLADKKEFILSVLLAAAAALTKQVGLYIVALLPFVAFLNSNQKSKKLFWYCLAVLGLGVILVLPWYLPRGIEVLQGSAGSGMDTYVTHSTDVYDTASPFLRTWLALLGLGKYLVLYALTIPAIFILKKKYKFLIVFFLIPFTLLWCVFVSYSVRNLSLTFPLLAVLSGLTLTACLEFGFRLLEKIKFGRLGAAFLALLVLLPVLYFGLRWNDDALISHWQEKQKQIFSAELNEQLYALDLSRPECKSILTSYPVRYLPDLDIHQIGFYFDDYQVYLKNIADPSVCWILVPVSSQVKAVKQDIQQRLDDGSFKLIFTLKNWVPYQLIQIH